MSEAGSTLVTLFDWTCRVQDELDDLKSAFPEVLRADRTRLLMSLSCLRVSLEIRLKGPGMKRPGAASIGTGPQEYRQSPPY